MTNEFTKELMAITQYAVASDTVYTESKVREMLKDLLKHFEQTTENEKCEEKKEEIEEIYSLLLKDRKELVKSYKKWCEEHKEDEYSQENLIAWMQIKGLLSVKKAKELLKEIKNE